MRKKKRWYDEIEFDWIGEFLGLAMEFFASILEAVVSGK